MKMKAFRGRILHFLADPGEGDSPSTYEYFEDGVLVTEHGRITRLGPYSQLAAALPSVVQPVMFADKLIMPGFVDTHIHLAQTEMIASPGGELLQWLQRYTFPTELRFEEEARAAEVSEFFLSELLRSGTTTAAVFAGVRRASVDAFFTAAARRKLRMVAGKVLMDRHCPEGLRDSTGGGYTESASLIEQWHGHERLRYAITPRFAVSSSDDQLALAGKLAREHPDVHVQSHLAENAQEVAWVRKLFPWCRSYLDVYDRYGLLRERAIFAHCIHLDDDDRARMAASKTAVAFCPTSNLFLGSGLFDLKASAAAGMRIGVGTDVGGGTSFSMLRTLAEGYKVTRLRGATLSALQAFYFATLGGAQALGLADVIGNFAPGKEADFIVLNLHSTDLIHRRMHTASSLAEQLFVTMLLGDDRAVDATYILAEPAYTRS